MERLLKARAKGGFQQIVPPGVLRFLDFARLNLVKGEKHSAKAQGREYVLDIFSGRATVTVEIANGQRQVFSNVGAAPGYELHYTWVLAGEERRYGAWADDPRHAWVKNA